MVPRGERMGAGKEFGPKAESLRKLAGAGLPVPEARFLAAHAYCEHATQAGVTALLAGADGPLDAAEVRTALLETPIDPETLSEIDSLAGSLGAGAIAVRSSATLEDMPESSFAGQYETLFVSGPEAVAEAVLRCWASLFSDRAVRYREHGGIPHAGAAMAVILQRVVPAVCAGVAFTADPRDGSDRILVESCFGMGESLVSGRVAPDSFVFERDGMRLIGAAYGDKPVCLTVGDDGAVREERLDEAAAAAPSADKALAKSVAQLAQRAEALFDGAVDVEWAFDGECVWLLQARPVTTLGPVRAEPNGTPPVASVDTTTPTTSRDADVTIWSNVNTGEILPDVATPMTWSIIHEHADDIVGGMFRALGVRFDAQRIIGLVGGRIYFNLTMLRDSMRHLPGLNPDIALGGMHDFVELPELDNSKLPWPSQALTVARAAVGMPGYVLMHTPGRAVRFAARSRAATLASFERIEAVRTPPEALAIVRSLIEEFSEFNDSLSYMAVAMFGFGVLGGVCNKWLEDATGALANRLVAGSGDVASAEAGHEIWRLGVLAGGSKQVRSAVLVGSGWADVRARLEAAGAEGAAFLTAWDDFMSEHGHHRRGELEFSNPTWAETPDYILGIIRSYLAEDRGSDPLAGYAERAQDADRVMAECLERLGNPFKRWMFRRAISWGRASARTRENVKSEAVRWLVAIRYSLLALGRLTAEAGALDRADDIFFLTYEELGPLAGGERTDWHSLVATRRTERERLEKLSPPPVVVGVWDEGSGPWTPAAQSRTLKGITVSAGVVRGRARVFLTVDTDEPVLPGEILVAPFTDPGWTPYFVPAAGIVMDMGGLLSHGSIIAREYGIPAVVNVGPATRLIRTGDLIEVDGDLGEVRILG